MRNSEDVKPEAWPRGPPRSRLRLHLDLYRDIELWYSARDSSPRFNLERGRVLGL